MIICNSFKKFLYKTYSSFPNRTYFWVADSDSVFLWSLSENPSEQFSEQKQIFCSMENTRDYFVASQFTLIVSNSY